jgi:D-methionine transport system permease protein
MSNALLNEFVLATWQTVYMTFLSGMIALIFGLPLGIFLLITRKNNILANPYCNYVLAVITNIIRSIPFIILLVAVIPLTRFITGTSIGTTAAIVPLSIAAIPFFGRLVEAALSEVEGGLIEAGLAMGATSGQMMMKILIPEAFPGILNGITITLINLVGYSAMAGAIGGGGLGDLAIRYGYHRFDMRIMIATIIVLIIIVQLLQWLGDYAARKYSHR